MGLDELLAEYMRQVDQGLTDREAFLRAHPEAEEALRELLDTEDKILRLAGPPESDAGNQDPNITEALSLSTSTEDTLPLPNQSTSDADIDLSGDNLGDSSPPLLHNLDQDLSEPIPFGNYELLEIIGRGGMGVVYRARQQGLDREVAVKMILNSHLASDEDITRFYTEARAAANIRHENVVDIYEIGEVDAQHFFSMELIIGSDLGKMVREGRLESRRAARMLRSAASAVEAAHQQGLLHRDIKPANILVDEQDRVVVTDFGLARDVSDEDQMRLTATGLAMGTPAYMSPEQASGKRHLMGPTTDVFSLGTVLFAMLTGTPPHRGETVMDTLMSVIHHAPEHPNRLNAEADLTLSRICLKCLEKDPKDRYQTAQQLIDDLDRYLAGEPVMAQGATRIARCSRWAAQIPVIAGMLGRHSPHPTQGQLRAQAGLILATLLTVVFLVAYPSIQQYTSSRMPSEVAIAGGIPDGVYGKFAERLAEQLRSQGVSTKVNPSSGSGANRHDLLHRRAHLALLQESLVGNDEIAIIAPVFDELVHIVVREDRIKTWQDLEDATVAIGVAGSGMADAAAQVMKDVKADLVNRHFTDLATDHELDGAVVTIGRGSAALNSVLAEPGLRLLPLAPDVVERLAADPRFRPVRFQPERFASSESQTTVAESIPTVATPAFLACRRDAPPKLVRKTLELLYPPLASYQMDLEAARHWNFMPLHPEARRFFEEADNHN